MLLSFFAIVLTKKLTLSVKWPFDSSPSLYYNGVFTRSSKRPANFQQTSSKRPANFQQTSSRRPAIHVYFEYICFMHLCNARHYSQEDMCIIGKEKEEEVCWTFARSCKHPINGPLWSCVYLAPLEIWRLKS